MKLIFFIVIISQSRILSWIKEVKPNSQCRIPHSDSSNSDPITLIFSYSEWWGLCWQDVVGIWLKEEADIGPFQVEYS